MFKKLFLAALFAMVSVAMIAQPRAKYVFFFIGDGMGVNQINGTEMYLSSLKGKIGTEPLCFASFPYTAFITTFSATNGVTDSAAGGTALACGQKTKNGTLGLLPDLETPINSIAVAAQKGGAAVGISTTVSVDHATPAAFYAHVKGRGEYHKIGLQLLDSKFDFFAGSDFEPKQGGENLYELAKNAGYTIANGLDEFRNVEKNASHLILFQTKEANAKEHSCIPYKLDRNASDLTLKQICESGIDYLTKQDKKGFFFMLEGGKIDWCCHANEAASAFNEVIDMDEAVKVAFDFYQKHKESTLIVISADHETGGIALGTGSYDLYLQNLQYVHQTAGAFTARVDSMRKAKGEDFSWGDAKQLLAEGWGFGKQVNLSDEQTNRLKAAFDKLKLGNAKDEKSMYDSEDALANTAKVISSEVAHVGWQSGGHSAGYVPVFAIGAGAEQFHGRIDNTQIPKLIAKAAGWDLK